MAPMQYRPQSGGLPYAPDRDLVHIFPSICQDVAKSFDEARHPTATRLLLEHGVSWEEVVAVCEAYFRFVQLAHAKGKLTPREAAQKSGLTETNPVAQAVFGLYMGQAVISMFFAAYRDATAVDAEERMDMRQLRTYARYVRAVLRRPHRSRWWRSMLRWVRRWAPGKKGAG
jgi:hypothetical protein